jgi:hypothetical protein
MITRRFDPMLAILSVTLALAPWLKATMTMTAITPMIIPSMVKPERSLWARMLLQAI